MKNKIVILSMSLCLLLASTAISFADAVGQPGKTGVSNTGPVVTKSVVPRANGLSANAIRISSTYAEVTFSNSTSRLIRDEVKVYNTNGDLISDSFAISVPAGGDKSYDVYVGGEQLFNLKTLSHGTIKIYL